MLVLCCCAVTLHQAFTAALQSDRSSSSSRATPILAWNTWNRFACNVSEALIKSAADDIVSLGLRDLGYNYINIDDCWQQTARDELGKLQSDPVRFPQGMKGLGKYLHDISLEFGIYSSAGFFTCAAGGTFPASLGMEEVDAQSFASWGVSYLKYDNCMEDKGRPDVRYPFMAQALANTGHDIFYSLCEWGRENPAVWAPKIGANSWRISADISDKWQSIITRADINAPLWRYAGTAYYGGFNDPDMLEVGNGGCSDEEYKSHFSLWAIMKSPLILGMDLSLLTRDSPSYKIISNKEVIEVNQDSYGYQARRVYSDSDSTGNKLLTTKCAWDDKTWSYQDLPADQVWKLRSDGRIESGSTGLCLVENDDRSSQVSFAAADFLEIDIGVEMDSISMIDCKKATEWDFFAGSIGGSIISKDSGLCLEVNVDNNFPLWQGKRLQTNRCVIVDRTGIDGTTQQATHGIDSQEHQSWVVDHRVVVDSDAAIAAGHLKNLYQRQCLTVDRDASKGKNMELWQSPLSDGGFAVLLLNRGKTPLPSMDITMEMLQIDGATKKFSRIRDLWSDSASARMTTTDDGVIRIEESVPSHGVVFLRLYI